MYGGLRDKDGNVLNQSIDHDKGRWGNNMNKLPVTGIGDTAMLEEIRKQSEQYYLRQSAINYVMRLYNQDRKTVIERFMPEVEKYIRENK